MRTFNFYPIFVVNIPEINAVFGIFFIKEILTHFGTQPLNNFGVETPYFSLSDGKFTNNFDPNIEENFPHQLLNKLLGTNIDNIFLFKINSTNRRLIMDLFLRYMSSVSYTHLTLPTTPYV